MKEFARRSNGRALSNAHVQNRARTNQTAILISSRANRLRAWRPQVDRSPTVAQTAVAVAVEQIQAALVLAAAGKRTELAPAVAQQVAAFGAAAVAVAVAVAAVAAAWGSMFAWARAASDWQQAAADHLAGQRQQAAALRKRQKLQSAVVAAETGLRLLARTMSMATHQAAAADSSPANTNTKPSE